MQRRPFFGWTIAAVSGLGLATGIATIVAATFSIFVGPIREEFGWSASLPFWAPLAVTLTTAIAAPWVGSFVDRYGARRIVLVSFVLEALILLSFYWHTPSIWGFYLRYVALGAFALGTTHIAFARVIAMWFDRRRGLALGIALAGVGIGGMLLPLLCQALIGAAGWRAAYVGLAAVIVFVTLPVLALTLRDSPADLGLRVDGDDPAEADLRATPSASAPPAGLTLEQARQDPFYWTMLLTFLLIGIGLQSVMLHLVPMLRSRGVDPMLAATAQSTLFFGLVIGRLITGWLMDRFFAPRVALAFLLAPIVGIAVLALGGSGWTAFAAAALVGLAAGAEVDVIAFLTSRYFGLRQYSRIYGTYYAVYSLGGGVGPLLTAQALERTGSYAPILWVHISLLAIAALLLSRFRSFPTWQRSLDALASTPQAGQQGAPK